MAFSISRRTPRSLGERCRKQTEACRARRAESKARVAAACASFPETAHFAHFAALGHTKMSDRAIYDTVACRRHALNSTSLDEQDGGGLVGQWNMAPVAEQQCLVQAAWNMDSGVLVSAT